MSATLYMGFEMYEMSKEINDFRQRSYDYAQCELRAHRSESVLIETQKELERLSLAKDIPLGCEYQKTFQFSINDISKLNELLKNESCRIKAVYAINDYRYDGDEVYDTGVIRDLVFYVDCNSSCGKHDTN